MKILALILLILLWVSIGVGSLYGARVVQNKPLTLSDVILGALLSPLATLVSVAVIADSIEDPCLANCGND